ncbi:MAG: helix-turn-helix transcriptional regulator [Acidimicrobiales bacterium]
MPRSAVPVITFGDELRRWREARRHSQLALSAAADVSQRHLSFLETGKSKPSREMVLHLGRSLDLSLRDQNALLASAGFAPEYVERGLDDPDLDEVRHTLDAVLAAHGHIPVYVVDRGWDLVMANPASLGLAALAEVDPPIEVSRNVMRTCFHPDGIRSKVHEWERFATVLLHRLEREIIDRPFDSRLTDLLAEARTYPGVADLPGRPPLPTGNDLMLPTQLETPAGTLRLISMIATIGAPFDITLEELRIESLLPADRFTESVLRAALPSNPEVSE